MKVLFLGTGAYDYSPLLNTTYKNAFDYDVRRSSSILIDESMLVDCGDFCLDSIEIAKVDRSKITDLLITHTHRDHCRLDNIDKLSKEVKGKLNIWCHESITGYFLHLDNCIIHGLNTAEKQKAGDMEFTALLSNHTTEQKIEKPVHYIIEKKNKKLFYGCDGAWFLTETFYGLMNQKFDLFVFDGTVGDYDGDYRIGEHNSIPMVRFMIQSMKRKDVFSERCKIYISHLAASLHAPHKEIVRNLEKDNILVAYDGLVEII